MTLQEDTEFILIGCWIINSEDAMGKIEDYLDKLGFDNSQGSEIIRQALYCILEKDTDIFVLKDIVKELSNKLNIKEANIERKMRLQIEKVFLYGNLEILHKEFEFISEEMGRPSNKEFLATIAEKIRIAD